MSTTAPHSSGVSRCSAAFLARAINSSLLLITALRSVAAFIAQAEQSPDLLKPPCTAAAPPRAPRRPRRRPRGRAGQISDHLRPPFQRTSRPSPLIADTRRRPARLIRTLLRRSLTRDEQTPLTNILRRL